MSANNEQTEEHIEKQDKVLNQLGNKRQMVLDFLSKGEKLMEDPNCPKFLEGHAKKLKEAWEETTEKANARKKALAGWVGVLGIQKLYLMIKHFLQTTSAPGRLSRLRGWSATAFWTSRTRTLPLSRRSLT